MKRKDFPALKRIVGTLHLFSAYRKTAAAEELIKAIEAEKERAESGRIRCPLCSWSPKKSSLWFCADTGAPEYFYRACGTLWNTFETRGRCPGCAHQWRWTSCLACHAWSRHEDWYEKKPA